MASETELALRAVENSMDGDFATNCIIPHDPWRIKIAAGRQSRMRSRDAPSRLASFFNLYPPRSLARPSPNRASVSSLFQAILQFALPRHGYLDGRHLSAAVAASRNGGTLRREL